MTVTVPGMPVDIGDAEVVIFDFLIAGGERVMRTEKGMENCAFGGSWIPPG
jgi:hypothetical protein